ncbi:hypothetical protein ACFFP0_19290 [Rhizobium puerariae]|uniref:Uncharacterized protein n=1 Tax=Rhizobium puerariae TaxID=1585791 RepID=A0ABV6AMQ6_9HYPH
MTEFNGYVGIVCHQVAVRSCVVVDTSGRLDPEYEFPVPVAHPTRAYIVAIFNDHGETLVSRLVWSEAEAQLATAAMKEEWQREGRLRYIGPLPVPPPE